MTTEQKQELKERIMRIENKIEMNRLYAQSWMTSILCGTNKARDIKYGNGKKLTTLEKNQSTLKIINNLIYSTEELTEQKIKYLRDLNKGNNYE